MASLSRLSIKKSGHASVGQREPPSVHGRTKATVVSSSRPFRGNRTSLTGLDLGLISVNAKRPERRGNSLKPERDYSSRRSSESAEPTQDQGRKLTSGTGRRWSVENLAQTGGRELLAFAPLVLADLPVGSPRAGDDPRRATQGRGTCSSECSLAVPVGKQGSRPIAPAQ